MFGSNFVDDLETVAAAGLTEAKYIQSVATEPHPSTSPVISAIIARQPLEMGAAIGPHLDTIIQEVPLFRGIRSTPTAGPDFIAGLEELGKRNGTYDILGSIVGNKVPFYDFVRKLSVLQHH